MSWREALAARERALGGLLRWIDRGTEPGVRRDEEIARVGRDFGAFKCLQRADIYALEAGLCEALWIAAQQLQSCPFPDELFPSEWGWLYLGAPVALGHVPQLGEELSGRYPLRAISWEPAGKYRIDPSMPIDWRPEAEGGRYFIGWFDGPGLECLMPDATVPSPPGLALDRRIYELTGERFLIAALLYTALSFCNERLAIAEPMAHPREARRRAEREGRELPAFRVIRLRAREQAGAGAHEVGAVAWSCQWAVRGHWRDQPYGEGRQLRRPKWIAPYIKGPADKPLREAERVFAVVR